MEKEQILSTIQEKLGQTSLSSRTIENYVSRHLPSEGTEPDENYWNTHVGELKAFATDYSGQHSHEMATNKKLWEEEWKKTHPAQPVTTNVTEGNNSELDALKAQISELEAKFKGQEKTLSVTELKKTVAEKAESLKVLNKALWNDIVASFSVEDGDTADTLVTKVKSTYESKLKAYNGDGAQPYAHTKPAGQSSEEQKEAMARREAFLDGLRKSGKLPPKKE